MKYYKREQIKYTLRDMFTSWWFILWLAVIVLAGAGAWAFVVFLMEAPWLSGAVIGLAALVLLVYFLFMYWVFRSGN